MILKVLKAMFHRYPGSEQVNELGLPPDWPVETAVIKDDEQVDPPWLKMTKDELEALREAHREQYKDWAKRQREITEEKEADEEKKRDEPAQRCRKKLKELGFEQDEIYYIMRWKRAE